MEPTGMTGLFVRWAVNTVALAVTAYVFDGISIRGVPALLVAGLLIGMLNAFVRPVLIFLTLPLTVVTLGGFILVINALLFWLVSNIVSGFEVAGFWSALGGTIFVSIVSFFLNLMIGDEGKVAMVDFRNRQPKSRDRV
jgi:putative membrane protein